MSKLVIKGSKKYCKRLEKQLKVEHPSTKNKMKVVNRESCAKKDKDDSLFGRAIKSSKKKPYFSWK